MKKSAGRMVMMLRMSENHVLEASKHREMVEEKAQKGIREARENVAMDMWRND